MFSAARSPSYLAGDDRSRAQALMRMFMDDEVKAVFCTRGGYGSTRLLPLLDLPLIRRHPKPLVGFSDITALLLVLLQKTPCPVFHGPMVSTLGKGISRASLSQLFRVLNSSGPSGELSYRRLSVIRRGKARGRLTGGCLSIVIASLGTPWEIVTDGAILFLEDRGEAPYRIDRMLVQLRQAGKLGSVRGIVFGQMPGCGGHGELKKAISSGLGDFKGPVALGFPSGHVTGRTFYTLPLGVEAALDLDVPSLSLLESPFS